MKLIVCEGSVYSLRLSAELQGDNLNLKLQIWNQTFVKITLLHSECRPSLSADWARVPLELSTETESSGECQVTRGPSVPTDEIECPCDPASWVIWLPKYRLSAIAEQSECQVPEWLCLSVECCISGLTSLVTVDCQARLLSASKRSGAEWSGAKAEGSDAKCWALPSLSGNLCYALPRLVFDIVSLKQIRPLQRCFEVTMDISFPRYNSKTMSTTKHWLFVVN